MDPITQAFIQGAAGAAGGATYAEDLFSTYLYKGDGSTRSIDNGIDLSTKGGLTWIKRRDGGVSHRLFDTERGATKVLYTNLTSAQATATDTLTSFNNNGFSLDGGSGVNDSGDPFASYSFLKAPGFFDIQTWTGNGTAGRQIPHNLGCVPGMIIVKSSSHTQHWTVYHRDPGANMYALLSNTDHFSTFAGAWNNTEPTASVFTVGNDAFVNWTGYEYVAYIFAGGKSTTDVAVDFAGTGDNYLSMPVGSGNTDFDWAADDSMTIECFVNMDVLNSQTYHGIVNRWGASGSRSFGLDIKSNGNLFFYHTGGSSESNGLDTISTGAWYHIAVVKDGTTGRFFINGQACGTFTWNTASSGFSQDLHVGNLADNNAYDINGKLSHVRITMKEARYGGGSERFNIPHEITNDSNNVKLLCCDKATPTQASVAPGTITAVGNPTVTTNNRFFDDTAANVFGEDADQNMIRCGSYVGSGQSNGPDITLGWEPSFIILKSWTKNSENWTLQDNMRGLASSDSGITWFKPNSADPEATGTVIKPTSTGFKITATDGGRNHNGQKYVYMAIRRPDSLVGKPVKVGTDVFAMDMGNSSSTIPCFDSGFPVDFSLMRRPASAEEWFTSGRLIQGKYLYTNGNNAEQSHGNWKFDDNTGWSKGFGSSYQSWMWKRHAGFDVVTWLGTNGYVHRIHNLGRTPEMIWYKNRDATRSWRVYHKALNGGTNPEDYAIAIDSSSAAGSNTSYMNGTAPTSRTFVSGNDGDTNGAGDNYIALLFASVAGISKVGSYTGNASASGPTINLGFAPRFILIKAENAGGTNWFVYDTTRGLTSGNDARIYLDLTNSQTTSADDVDPTATGFQIVTTWDQLNGNNANYIYYAHA